jgi:molybdopterin-synthase adenylyltransferase
LINTADFKNYTIFSVALTETVHTELMDHLNNSHGEEEDLAFALWVPSYGKNRLTAIVTKIILPEEGDRNQHGNASFNMQFIERVLKLASDKFGIAFLHSHLGPGWQGMSYDDEVAERDRLAGPVAGRTNLPLLGMTSGTDGSWSARFWLRKDVRKYERRWAHGVRVVGRRLRITFHPNIIYSSKVNQSQVATASVWGNDNQLTISNTHVGIIGLGSVGSIVAESLSRIGISHLTLIDHDKIEMRNLDRTLGATNKDAENKTPKVEVIERMVKSSHTSDRFQVNSLAKSLISEDAIKLALDCDILFSCVDRPWPRHILNALAYSHLIPVVDGGIIAKVQNDRPIHINWRIHTVGPERKCLVCLKALKRGEIQLDKDGKLDDPVYIKGLGEEFDHLLSRQNVFAFSMSVAAHEVLQFIGLVTGLARVGGIGSQIYHAYPGRMDVEQHGTCEPDCEYNALTASAADMYSNIV